jgi:hypothetical protein
MPNLAVTDVFLMTRSLLCSAVMLTLLIGFLLAVGAAVRESIARLKLLHSIPCERCTYFTGCHLLKCTVHPCRALTEEAVGCMDFEQSLAHEAQCSKRCKC